MFWKQAGAELCQAQDFMNCQLTKQAPPRFYFLSYFLEILSQTEYLSDIHHQWLIWKIITEPSKLSNNINMFDKENVEKMAVEKSILLADLT